MSAQKIVAVVFDWAGTLIDHGSRAPAVAFVEAFRRAGLDVSEAEARGPMGMAKRDHVAALLRLDRVSAAFAAAHGRAPTERDVDAIYASFVPLQLEVLRDHADLVPGAREVVATLRARGVRVATTTGYDREMSGVVLGEAERQGLVPDVAICASDVSRGRPAPFMCWAAAHALGVYPARAIVKVGDTVADVEDGRNAGMWSVGVTRTGNELGLSLDEVRALGAAELDARLSAAEARLRVAGAHAVVPSIEDVPDLLATFEARLARGESP